MDSKFYSKCDILAQIYDRYRNDHDWQAYFSYHDIGIPTALAIAYGGAQPTEKGIAAVNESWVEACKIIMVDSEEEYEWLDDMLEIGVMDENE